MNRRERVALYALLTLLTAFNLLIVLGWTGRSALADETVLADGPDAFPSLTLVADDPQKNVVLRNRDGRLAWGDAVHDQAFSVGYVHIGKILRQLMRAESRTEERQHLLDELNETEADFRQRLDDVVERMRELDPESDEARQLEEQGRALFDEYRAWQQNAIARRGKLEAEQLEAAYREMIDAVEVVADRKSIDTIYRFIPTGEPFETENPEQAMLAIRMRTALRYPADLDITDDVIEELDLEIE